MRCRYAILLLLCFALGLNAQKNIPATVLARETPITLSRQLQQISGESFLQAHAIDYPLNMDARNAFRQGNKFYWKIEADDLGIRLFLNIGELPPGDTLFILNGKGEKTEYVCRDNTFEEKWNTAVYSEVLTAMYQSYNNQIPLVQLRSYSLEHLTGSDNKKSGFGDSAPCEINVNCPEGDDYQEVKKSVVRIMVKVQSAYYFCTGTLMNNTALDRTPYILTSEHCGNDLANNFITTAADLQDWVFYFQYTAPGCSNPPSEGSLAQMQVRGATLIARSDDGGGESGSDFLLLLLDTNELNSLKNIFGYEPYYAGWSRSGQAPQSGVTIHHPNGDIKKISTFNFPATSGAYNSSISDDTHWLTGWDATTSGHAATEGGSSGCPLLNENGLVTGNLTGGAASCQGPTFNDYFGKFSYSWDQNGSTPNRRLMDWLDPINSGVMALAGMGDSLPPLDDFSLSPIPVDGGILTIKGLEPGKEFTIGIFDIRGSLIHNEEYAASRGAEKEIAVDGLANGIYFVRIVNKGNSKTVKIMVHNP